MITNLFSLGTKAVVIFEKPECLLRPENILGTGSVDANHVIHAAIETYMARRLNSVDEKVTNKLVLNLPFESENKCSSELLDHKNGIVCPMGNPPKGGKKMYSHRNLILTFKEKASNYTSTTKASTKVAVKTFKAPETSKVNIGEGNKKRAVDGRAI